MKKKLVSFFKQNPNRLFKNKEIAKRLRISEGHEYEAMKAVLHKLYEEDFLLRSGKRYKINSVPMSGKITGILQINQGGYGFVIPEKKDAGDIFTVIKLK
jgi:exoribonuclease R